MPIPNVSIHAFRGEGDLHQQTFALWYVSFNPRLPGGRRPGRRGWSSPGSGFNPRLPGGKATLPFVGPPIDTSCFNPRLPGGRRHQYFLRLGDCSWFQSTPSGGKATFDSYSVARMDLRFNPRLPGGRRHLLQHLVSVLKVVFQSTPSGGKATNRGRTYFGPLSEFQSTPSGGKATIGAARILGR